MFHKASFRSRLRRIQVRSPLEYKFLEYRIPVAVGMFIFQKTPFGTRLYRIPVRSPLRYRLLEYRILLWWNLYIPEHPILEPFVQDPSKEPSGI